MNNEHLWFIERIEARIAEGLSAEDRLQFDGHADGCPACASLLADAHADDRRLAELFASQQPAADFEQRLIDRLRSATAPRRRIHPAIRRAALSAAAVIVIGITGYMSDRVLHPQANDQAVGISQRTTGASLARAGIKKQSDADSSFMNDPATNVHNTEIDVLSDATKQAIISQIQDSIRKQDYKDALGKIDQILLADPTNDFALGVRPLVNDRFVLQQQGAYRQKFDGEVDKQLNDAEEKKIPYEDIMRYPTNWPDISALRDDDAKWGIHQKSGDPRYLAADSGGDGIADAGTTGLPMSSQSGITYYAGVKVEDNSGVPESANGQRSHRIDTLPLFSSPSTGLGDNRQSLAALHQRSHELGDALTDNTAKFEAADRQLRYSAEQVADLTAEVAKTQVSQTGKDDGAMANAAAQPTAPYNPDQVGGEGSSTSRKLFSENYDYSGKLAHGADHRFDPLVLNYPPNKNAEARAAQATIAEDFRAAANAAKADAASQVAQDSESKTKDDAGVAITKQSEAQQSAEQLLAGSTAGVNTTGGSTVLIEREPGQKQFPVIANTGKVAVPDGGTLQLGGKTLAGGTTVVQGAPSQFTQAPITNVPGSIGSSSAPNPAQPGDGGTPIPAHSRTGQNDTFHHQIPSPATPSAAPSASSSSPPSPTLSQDSVLLPTEDDSDELTTQGTKDEKSDGVANRQFTTPTLYLRALIADSANPSKPTGHNADDKNSDSSTLPPVAPSAAPLAASEPQAVRKIIRTGAMEFEVDSFDSAAMRLQKIVEEESGYIGTTDSDRLGNGKMSGTITVRVPPENLDVLVLKLRGLGDLKSQKIAAEDVTKQFTDFDSELRAAQAMETRLLAIIKDGKGEVKDLLEAEQQLGVWREKIEAIEGELRYLNSQVALSTLAITLTERDLKTPTAAFESEQVTLSLESEKVDDAYVKAKEAITEAKGRIIQSELKQYEAGQYGAQIVADVGPDQAEALIGRLRQFPGRVATFNRERKQTTEGGSGAPLGIKVEQRDTRFDITLYNLATIAPRRTTNLTLASPDVEQASGQIQTAVTDAGGRIVSAVTTRPNANQISASLHFEVPMEKADAVLLALRGVNGEISKLESTDNADLANSTAVKQGFAVEILPFSMVLPRETYTRELATTDVVSSHQAILNAAHLAKARIIASTLSEQDLSNITADLDFEIARSDQDAIEHAIVAAGEIIGSNVQRWPDGDNVINGKVQYKVSLVNAERLAPRETTSLGIEVGDVDAAMNDAIAEATGAHGRSLESTISKENDGRATARVVIDVPLDQEISVLTSLRQLGTVRVIQSTRNPQVPEGKLARARFDLTLVNPQGIVEQGQGPWAKIREGLSTGLLLLLTLLKYLIIGLFFTGPFLILYGFWRVLRRKNRAAKPAAPLTN